MIKFIFGSHFMSSIKSVCTCSWVIHSFAISVLDDESRHNTHYVNNFLHLKNYMKLTYQHLYTQH